LHGHTSMLLRHAKLVGTPNDSMPAQLLAPCLVVLFNASAQGRCPSLEIPWATHPSSHWLSHGEQLLVCCSSCPVCVEGMYHCSAKPYVPELLADNLADSLQTSPIWDIHHFVRIHTPWHMQWMNNFFFFLSSLTRSHLQVTVGAC